jgi:nucleoside-diphosphate-sugar epimerase
MLVIVFGAGFVGKPLCHLLKGAGHDVIPVVRHEADGFSACDITDPRALKNLRGEVGQVDAMVHCASSSKRGNEDRITRYRAVYLEACRNMIRVFSPARLVFASSSSVYGQTDGTVVDESSSAEPSAETGKILLEAEQVVLAYGGLVARLAGIYGPGRSYLLKRYIEGSARIDGESPDAPGRWINQVHRDDAASALAHLVRMSEGPGIYNVCDETPLSQRACYNQFNERFGLGIPEVLPPETGRLRGWSNKRVSGASLRASGWHPRYPSYFDALDHDPELLPSIIK